MRMDSTAKTGQFFENGEKEEDYLAQAHQLMSSTFLSMTMHTAIELGVFEIIMNAGPDAKLSASEIVASTPASNPDAHLMLDRILRLLSAFKVLGCTLVNQERLYNLTPVSKYFVGNEDGVSFSPLMNLVQDKTYVMSYFELKNAVLEGGIPFNRVHGMHVFEYAKLDPRFNEILNTAMVNANNDVIKEILQSYKGFEQLKNLVDVGGGLGATLGEITSKYPHIKGVNFDLPHVIQCAAAYPGVEHVGGDMFESVPTGEVILIKNVLHSWSDDHCLKLLKNCYKAIPHDGKLIIVEEVYPDTPDGASLAAKIISVRDVAMMLQSPGGKERTRHEFMALATGAGFSGIRYESCRGNLCVMEFYK